MLQYAWNSVGVMNRTRALPALSRINAGHVRDTKSYLSMYLVFFVVGCMAA